MGTYINQSDLEDVFGTDNVVQWSNLDNTTTDADTDRIASAIGYAENIVESRFRGSRYSVPLTAVSGTLYEVKRWCAVLAGVWLYNHRPTADEEDAGRFNAQLEQANAEMDAVLAGTRRLNAARNHSDAPGAPQVIT